VASQSEPQLVQKQPFLHGTGKLPSCTSNGLSLRLSARMNQHEIPKDQRSSQGGYLVEQRFAEDLTVSDQTVSRNKRRHRHHLVSNDRQRRQSYNPNRYLVQPLEERSLPG
jgi:hypothetical protein